MSRGRLRTSTHVRQLPRPRASGGLHANPPPAPVRSPGNQPVLRRRGPERCEWHASPAKPRTTRPAFRRRRSREPAPINKLAAGRDRTASSRDRTAARRPRRRRTTPLASRGRRRHARASTCWERFGRADGSAPRCDATRAQQSSRTTGTRSQPAPERLGISRDGADQHSGRPATGVVGAPRSRRRHASAGPGAATRARDDRARARRPGCRRTQPRARPRRRGAPDRRPDRSPTG